MTPLFAEFNRWMGAPFRWGETDCALVLADWVIRARGLDYDPAEHLRGAYDDMASCYRLTGWHRDPVSVVGDLAEQVGLDRTDNPQPGDIGVVTTLDDKGRMVAIGAVKSKGRSWAAKAKWGAMSGVPAQVLAAWSVGYEE